MATKGVSTFTYPMEFKNAKKFVSELVKLPVGDRKLSVDPRFTLFVFLQLNTGLRASDVLSLRLRDIDFIGGVIYKKQKKTGKLRTIKIFSSAKKMLNRIMKLVRNSFTITDFLFESPDTKDGILTVSWANRLSKRWLNRLRIPHRTSSTHTFRKTYAKKVWDEAKKSGNADAIMYLAAEILGHSSIQDTYRYLGINPEAINDIHKNLW